MKLKNSFKGFTLVEVLIVIIIVGILIAALLPRLTGSQQRARDTARTAAINQVAQAASLLIADQGALTTTGEVCITDLSSLAVGSTDLSSYLANLPTDPQGTNHDAEGDVTNWTPGACNGWAAIVADDGRSVLVFSDMESTTAGNYASFDADVFSGLADFQGDLTAGTDIFGAVVQG